MKSKFTRKMLALMLCMTVPFSFILTGCKSGVDREKTPLTIASEALDGVFNPFFYTAGADGEIVGQTQIGMLSGDENGRPIAGKDEPCVALDYSVVTTGTPADVNGDDYSKYYTDYYFAVKDDIKFSDGTPLTIKDVLFNMYMYLDPAYTGSSTMYSVKIRGLATYRTQTSDVNQQEGFDEYFNNNAYKRISDIRTWANNNQSTWESAPQQVKDDILKAHELFLDEVKSDWKAAPDAVESYKKYGFTEGWEVFLYQYGLIKVTPRKDANDKRVYDVDYNNYKDMAHDEETMVNQAYQSMVGGYESASAAYKSNIKSIITNYATAGTLRDYLVSDEISKYYAGDLVYRTVSGITTYKASSIPTENGGTRDLGKTLDILKITIDGVDPKAIQNFSFTVAPMHYYSSTADKFTLEAGKEYFGVEFADTEFMTAVKVKQVPLGAGPYRASTAEGTDSVPEKSEFYKNGIVYLERNDNFLLGAPKIKKICFQETSNTFMYESVQTGTVHFASPTAKNEMIGKLEGADKETMGYVLAQNLGYGYIGINASYVHDINVRRAIMHAMDVSECISYYGGNTLAETIYRPMSTTLVDYYPTEATAYYAYDGTGETSRRLVQEAGYSVNNNGIFENPATGDVLKFTFTIAGDSEDHPAYQTMIHAADVLNDIGFDITVAKDSTALSKLSAGTLAVWAAAWSSSSDPDMYQVYHKNSSATSVKAWGYPYLLSANTGTSEEKGIINDLAVLIEQGRETTVVAERKEIYKSALDKVMELAVELPTYQRKALYVYRKGVINEETLAHATAFQSPLSRIWEVDFV